MSDHPTSDAAGLIGQSVLRREDDRLLRGRSRYVADLQLAHQVHARFVRSTIARGRVTRIDTTAAEALPGVVAVITADDPELGSIRIVSSSTQKTHVETPQPILTRQVRFLGEAVAVVLATDRYKAADAAGLVELDYETEPVHIDALAAALDPEPPVHAHAPDNLLIHRTFDTGGVDECLADAPVVVEAEFRTNRHTGAPLEGRALLADYDAGRRRLTVHASHQSPYLLRWGLAPLLNMAESDIRVVTGDVGGGFGVKVSMYPEDVAVCALARRLERPVSWVDDRSEHLQVTMHARDHHYVARAGFDTDGRLLAVDATGHINVGAYSGFPWTAGIETLMAGGLLTGPYKLDQYRCRVAGVATNTTPAGPYRGVARPATTFVMERLLERAARILDMDPAEIRRLNLVQAHEVPWRSPTRLVHDSPTYVEVFDKVLDAIDYPTFRARQAAAAAQRRAIGVGFACYNELTGLGRRASAGPGLPFRTGHESATINAHPDGTFTLFAGVTSQGQGLETTMAQVAATELGVPIESIRMVIGDTDGAAFGLGAFASRQAVIGSGAVTEVARGLRQKILRIAAHLMEAEPEWLDITNGLVHTADAPALGVTVAEVAAVALLELNRLPDGEDPGLEHTAYYDPMVGTFAAGAQAALVEIDIDTGEVRVERLVCAEDAGTMLNPMIVEGQVHGAMAQGIGGALYEHLQYDDQGQLLTSTFTDYTIPSTMEIPALEVLHVSHPAENLTGVRGAGEGGTIGPPAAIANAVADALGIEVDRLPVTPERVIAALANRPNPLIDQEAL